MAVDLPFDGHLLSGIAIVVLLCFALYKVRWASCANLKFDK